MLSPSLPTAPDVVFAILFNILTNLKTSATKMHFLSLATKDVKSNYTIDDDIIVLDDEVNIDRSIVDFKAAKHNFTVDISANSIMGVNTTTITTTSPLNGHYAELNTTSAASSNTINNNNNNRPNIITHNNNNGANKYANLQHFNNFVGVGGGFKLPADPTASSAVVQGSSTTPDGKSIQMIEVQAREEPVASVEQLLRTLNGSAVWTSNLPYIYSSSSGQTSSTHHPTIPPTSTDVVSTPFNHKNLNNISPDKNERKNPQVLIIENPDASSSAAIKRSLTENFSTFSSQNKRFKSETSKNSAAAVDVSLLDQNHSSSNALPMVGENLTLTTSDTPPPSAAHFVTLSTSKTAAALAMNGKMPNEKRQLAPSSTLSTLNLPSTSNSIIVSQSDRPISAAASSSNEESKMQNDEENDDDSYFDDKASGTTASGTPCSTPSLRHPLNVGPIDPVVQEKLKLERKRARNRLAASKCRRRKLEVIDRLSDNVHEIESKNEQLRLKIELFRCDIAEIRLKIENHRKHGCNV
uniref:BZIP domain-containing protein n=1 Tax=Romanomermis culicivorax TaxID=13658 RepID=A0A915L2P0_ROMCU